MGGRETKKKSKWSKEKKEMKGGLDSTIEQEVGRSMSVALSLNF